MSHDVARLILKYAKEMEREDILHMKRFSIDKNYAFYHDLKNIICEAISEVPGFAHRSWNRRESGKEDDCCND